MDWMSRAQFAIEASVAESMARSMNLPSVASLFRILLFKICSFHDFSLPRRHLGPVLSYLACHGAEIVSRVGPKSMKSEVGVERRLSFGKWFVLMGFRVLRQRVIGGGGKIGGKRWDFGEVRD
ncbi:holo-[acyl-carrier-protein] synthase [Striga asiatica]|uniref:Holo-[acyl-carrier-protein] synthase n=1 Tax=Striga asiatica TaxID=4170 RepID=A0A5A7PKH8_STRAF|nr:holo-[acyl-carrier-protein] synthase [Striga asiatica]